MSQRGPLYVRNYPQPRGFLTFLSLLLFLGIAIFPINTRCEEGSLVICGKVVDAISGRPIPNATVLIWDIIGCSEPKIGAGIYITDSDGCYLASSPYLRVGRKYYIYAYVGDPIRGKFIYAPSTRKVVTLYEENSFVNVSFKLIPAGTIFLTDDFWYIESVIQPHQFSVGVIVTDPLVERYNATYLSRYGFGRLSPDTYFLYLNSRTIIVPANTKVYLNVTAFFYSAERGFFERSFIIDDGGKGFFLSQGESVNVSLAWFSLHASFPIIQNYVSKTLSEIEKARGEGFDVWNEREKLKEALSLLEEAYLHLTKHNYANCWLSLRRALSLIESIYRSLDFMRRRAYENAIYLPAFFAIYSVSLGLFLSESEKKKVILSFCMYSAILASLFIVYPGMQRAVAGERILTFLSFSILSILIVSIMIFWAPKVWKESSLEGRVSIRSAIATIFSIAKRQVKRRRIRCGLTLISIMLLVMAFTAFTSFGSVYGILSKTMPANVMAVGIFVERSPEDRSVLIPLSESDIKMLEDLKAQMIAPKVENMPSLNPIAQISIGNKVKDIYGMIGFLFQTEQQYTNIYSTMIDFKLDPEDRSGIILSYNLGKNLGIKTGDRLNITFGGIFSREVVVRGFFEGEGLRQKVDFNGRPIMPMRLVKRDEKILIEYCDPDDVILMDWREALAIQESLLALLGVHAPQIAVISRIIFTPQSWDDLSSLISILSFAMECTVFVAKGSEITKYYLGFRFEVKGVTEIIFSMIMVTLNVGLVMLTAVYERRHEIRVLSTVGLNPTHISFLFLAEAIVIAIIGGGAGYLFGLGFYRLMIFLGQELMVHPKIEWWWSLMGLLLSICVSLIAAIRPAALAVKLYTPSLIKRLRISEEERVKRELKIFKAFEEREYVLPVRVLKSEIDFFMGYLIDKLKERETRILEEGTQDIFEEPEKITPSGQVVRSLSFKYVCVEGGLRFTTENTVECSMFLDRDYYIVKVICKPLEPGMPEEILNRGVNLVHNILINWAKDRKRIVGRF